MHVRRAPTALAALALLLAGCGDDSPSTTPDDAAFNEADIQFATGMIPHHASALVMVDQLAGEDVSPELADLGERIRAAQAPEIEQLADWLVAWGEPVPETDRDHAHAHDMDGEGMDGDLGLEGMSGAAFEEHWLEMMIEHHEAAIDMAEAEIEDGESDEAVDLAGSIVESQQAEIDQMEQLLER
jgi:uncharacterized protein (DUF305 family)